MKLLVFTIAFISFVQISNAQITLDRSDFAVPGKKYFEAVKWDGLEGITPGEDGAGKFWDFSELISDDADTSLYILPSSVSAIKSFPESNMAHKFIGGYEFYNYNAAAASISGVAIYANAEFLIFDLDELPFFKFPASYTENREFSNTRVSYFKTKNNSTKSFTNSDSLNYKLTYVQSLEIKGWGKIKTPFDEADVLKIKTIAKGFLNLSHRNKVTGAWVHSKTTQKFLTTRYEFYTKNVGSPLLTLTYSDSTGEKLSNVSWYAGRDLIQSIEKEALANENNYIISPNPGIGTFFLNSPKNAISRITVLDIIGKEILTSYDLENGALEIDAPNGIYNVNLYTNNGIVVKRLVIQK